MHKKQEILVYHTLRSIIQEQADSSAPADDSKSASAIETDNSDISAKDSPFTPAEERFLGKFDAYGSNHLGIIYSLSDIGIREFIMRSGKDLNCTPSILLKLLRDKIVKIVPYTGWGRDNSYTIELQLSLDDVKGLGATDKEKAEKGSTASGAAGAGAGPSAEVAWVVRYGDLLSESANIAQQFIVKNKNNSIYLTESYISNEIPKQYVKHMEYLIASIGDKKYSTAENQHLISNILKKLHENFKLTSKQISESYKMHKKQKRYEKFANKK